MDTRKVNSPQGETGPLPASSNVLAPLAMPIKMAISKACSGEAFPKIKEIRKHEKTSVIDQKGKEGQLGVCEGRNCSTNRLGTATL